ncbi:MAG: SprT-like domain-containing protein [Chitinophagaceae bacterium]
MIPKKEVPLDILSGYLPDGTYEKVQRFLIRYKVHLTITRKRYSVLGDYRLPEGNEGHKITVNGDLNRYAFLLTLLHELAHLVAYDYYGLRIAPHGVEWKKTFRRISVDFMDKGYMPLDVEAAIRKYMQDPSARSCVDEDLIRVLKKYDAQLRNFCFVEDLGEGEWFVASDGREYCRGKKIRTRYMCMDVSNRKKYLFSPVYEVKRVKKE